MSEQFQVMEEAIVKFAQDFDPQPFHLNAETAQRTIFGGLTASGWHTAAITMRLLIRRLNFEGAIGLGVDELRWPAPVRPNDSLQVETEIIELRPSRSRPQFGVIRFRSTTRNQRGETVQTMFASALVPKKN